MFARHTTPHSEETKRKCSEAQKKRWAEGFYDNKILDYRSIAIKSRDIQRMGTFSKCLICSEDIYSSPSKKRKYCSRKCLFKAFNKSGHPNWKGGVTYLNKSRHRRTKEYLNWRKLVFERDNYTCQKCLKRGVFLHPHHIKSYTKFPEHRYDLDNGLTLCVECHKNIHSKTQKTGVGISH